MHLESYFEAHNVINQKICRGFLVVVLSTRTVHLLAGLCAPSYVQELTYDNAINLLAEYFAPKWNKIVESYKIFRRNQLPNEKTSDFIMEMGRIASKCNFGNALDRML